MPATIGLKDATVSMRGLSPQLALAAGIVAAHFAARGVPLLITSMNDGKHLARGVRHPRSLHYEGRAFDCRLPGRWNGSAWRDATNGTVDLVLRDALRTALGAEFDVVLEADHIHVEYDPPEAGVA